MVEKGCFLLRGHKTTLSKLPIIIEVALKMHNHILKSAFILWIKHKKLYIKLKDSDWILLER
jgi:hypothetical protein